jgi:hypothetical protein
MPTRVQVGVGSIEAVAMASRGDMGDFVFGGSSPGVCGWEGGACLSVPRLCSQNTY